MRKKLIQLLFFPICIYTVGCKTNPDSNRNYADRSKVYKLHLAPVTGSQYYYDISNESEISVELNDKKTKSLSKSSAGVYYVMGKDSLGNTLVTITYDKLHVYSKKGDVETDADAANGLAAVNPLEKMLGSLKDTKMSATINSKGEIINIQGYKELEDKIFSELNFNDDATKAQARGMWENAVGNGIIKNNMEELFRIFPDSSVHIGDSWKLNSLQNGFTVKNIYKLKAINDDLALIESEGVISSDSSLTNSPGLGGIPAELKGDQQGEYEMETKTGMLVSAKLKASIKGTVTAGGGDVPITIETSVKINGKKLK
ncbi:MAG TPA: DUF6263 family protein [Chitinophagaceae bacterium]|nr:DUF6263 family protein [Chitinophagaceae bacterium]